MIEKFSSRFHLLVIRKKWMELSPNFSFVLIVIEFYNNCVKNFLVFEPKVSSKKLIHIFQVSFQDTLFFDFVALLFIANGARLSFASLFKIKKMPYRVMRK